MVVGAGRGPLVRSAFNAATNVKRKIKMYVIEKNPNAIVTLTALKEEMWHEKGKHIHLVWKFDINFWHDKNLQFVYRHDDNLNGYEIFHACRKS